MQSMESPEELLARAYALKDPAEARSLYRDWAASYDASMLDGLGYLTPSLTAAMLAEATADRSAPVLDVAAGTGLAGKELAGHGFSSIDALDFSPEMLAVAMSRGVYRAAIEADLTGPLPLADAAYGAMICTGAFTHAHVGAGCLPELFRALKPGGLFACTIHKDVWEEAGFAAMTRRLQAEGVMRVVRHEAGCYYRGSTEPEGNYCLWSRMA